MSYPGHSAGSQPNGVPAANITKMTEGQYGPFVSGLLPDNDSSDGRLRSSSFSSVLRPRVNSQRAQHTPRRLSEELHPPRSGSADNIVNAQHHPHILHGSKTIAEIPPQHFSNDSGYHTPPFHMRHHISPPYQQQRTTWPAMGPPTPNPNQPMPLCVDPPTRFQPLTIETGHFRPEDPPPQLMIGQPSSAMPMYYNPDYHHYAYSQQPQSLPVQRLNPQTPEEAGVIGYQRQRKERLQQALNKCEEETTKLDVESSQFEELIKKLEDEILDQRDDNFDSEIQKLRQENQKLAVGIQALLKKVPDSHQLVFDSREVQQPFFQPPPQPADRDPHIEVTQHPTFHSQNPYRRNTSVPVPPRPSPSLPNSYSTVYPSSAPPIVPPRPPVYTGAGGATGGYPRQQYTRASSDREIMYEDVPDSVKWSCTRCTLLNHPLINVCEACDSPRAHRVQGQLSTSEAEKRGLVKTSVCNHKTPCFCHAHLG